MRRSLGFGLCVLAVLAFLSVQAWEMVTTDVVFSVPEAVVGGTLVIEGRAHPLTRSLMHIRVRRGKHLVEIRHPQFQPARLELDTTGKRRAYSIVPETEFRPAIPPS